MKPVFECFVTVLHFNANSNKSSGVISTIKCFHPFGYSGNGAHQMDYFFGNGYVCDQVCQLSNPQTVSNQ